jgi:hypothetical protein
MGPILNPIDCGVTFIITLVNVIMKIRFSNKLNQTVLDVGPLKASYHLYLYDFIFVCFNTTESIVMFLYY